MRTAGRVPAVLALAAVVVAAFLPARGDAADVLDVVVVAAIAALFFMEMGW